MIISYKSDLVKLAIKQWLDRNLFGAKTLADLRIFLNDLFKFKITVLAESTFDTAICLVSFQDENFQYITFHVYIETKKISVQKSIL